ncbi:MAG TPA: hypothetical protein VF588_00880 [Pyrinomonadaceae bacterium]|jgi:hypothetical protein
MIEDQDLRCDEEEILTACALRFDGYKYCEGTGFDYNSALNTYFEGGGWNIAPLEQLATFFMLQRGLFKWNLCYEPQDGRYWKAIRELFLLTYTYEISKEYRQIISYQEWSRRFVPHLSIYVKCVQSIHNSTQYNHTSIGTPSKPLS